MSANQLEKAYLIQLLSSVLHHALPQSPPENLNWEKLYQLSVRHSVSQMACFALEKLGPAFKPPQDIMVKFHQDRQKALAKEAVQHIEVEQIIKTFEEHRIVSMPLKGYVIKYLYPQPDMRLMADVDILYKDAQTEQVKKLMLGMGFTLKHQGGNHNVYYKKPFMNMEMHRRLISEDSPYSDYLSKAWDRAGLKAGCKYTYHLPREDYFIYMLIHLTKHYANGGTGIRSVMDVWVYNNRYKSELDWNYIKAELDNVKLQDFANSILGLAEVWFGSVRSNELLNEMAEYIFSSGVYGTREHALISNMHRNYIPKHSIRTAKLLYRLKLFFPPLNTMKILYPFLATLPFLLPVCWVLRGVRNLIFKHKYTMQMINNIHSVSEEDLNRIRNLHKRSGLHN